MNTIVIESIKAPLGAGHMGIVAGRNLDSQRVKVQVAWNDWRLFDAVGAGVGDVVTYDGKTRLWSRAK